MNKIEKSYLFIDSSSNYSSCKNRLNYENGRLQLYNHSVVEVHVGVVEVHYEFSFFKTIKNAPGKDHV